MKNEEMDILEKNNENTFSSERLKEFEEFEKNSGLTINQPIKGDDSLVLENSVGLFLSKVIEKCDVNRDGNLVIPYILISELTKQYMFVKKNRASKKTNNKEEPIHKIKCYYCGSANVSVEKRPNGLIICNDCGSTKTNKTTFTGCTFCGSKNVNVSGKEWECRDCGCYGKTI